MTDTGLSDRLRQQSRRSGLMVGLSMALTIAICVGVFVASYTRVGSALSDFLPEDATFVPTPDPGAAQVPAGGPAPPAPPTAIVPAADQGASQGEVIAPAETVSAFQPTHQIPPGPQINFRSSPGVAGQETVISTLAPETPLRFLGQEETIDGAVWMQFEIETGDEGWVREVDTETI